MDCDKVNLEMFQEGFINSTDREFWFISTSSPPHSSLSLQAIIGGREGVWGSIFGLMTDRFTGFGGRTFVIGSMKVSIFLE